jgi:hypothetical protein
VGNIKVLEMAFQIKFRGSHCISSSQIIQP